MSFVVTFARENLKFSAAHFTVFPDGQVERLHGHNYQVSVALHGEQLRGGLLFPFHEIKPQILALCQAWDERVLLPAASPALRIGREGTQVQVEVRSAVVRKFYSFPAEDVILLPLDNISCENLASHLLAALAEWIGTKGFPLHHLELSLSESPGQSVRAEMDLPAAN
jgi:6-pyruvoyltetrahydropterin/6-carboxytetrahydropterin synthase